ALPQRKHVLHAHADRYAAGQQQRHCHRDEIAQRPADLPRPAPSARHLWPPGAPPCASFAKSPITRCIEANVDSPDETTPCIAATTFCIWPISGSIAIAARASLTPGTPSI